MDAVVPAVTAQMPSKTLLAIVLYLTSTRAVPAAAVGDDAVGIAGDLRAFDHGTRRDPCRGLDNDAAATSGEAVVREYRVRDGQMRARRNGCELDRFRRRCGEILKRAILENHLAAGDLNGTNPACCSVENDIANGNDRSIVSTVNSKTTAAYVYDAPAIQRERISSKKIFEVGPVIQAADWYPRFQRRSSHGRWSGMGSKRAWISIASCTRDKRGLCRVGGRNKCRHTAAQRRRDRQPDL